MENIIRLSMNNGGLFFTCSLKILADVYFRRHNTEYMRKNLFNDKSHFNTDPDQSDIIKVEKQVFPLSPTNLTYSRNFEM